MKKSIKILLISLTLYIVIGISVVCVYLIPHFQQRKEDSWYETEVQQIALDYVEKLCDDTNKRGVLGCVYPSMDKEIVKKNRDLAYEEKSYPFNWVEVSIAVGRDIYVLTMEVISRGEFKITNVKKMNNDRYFTYW